MSDTIIRIRKRAVALIAGITPVTTPKMLFKELRSSQHILYAPLLSSAFESSRQFQIVAQPVSEMGTFGGASIDQGQDLIVFVRYAVSGSQQEYVDRADLAAEDSSAILKALVSPPLTATFASISELRDINLTNSRPLYSLHESTAQNDVSVYFLEMTFRAVYNIAQ